MRKVMVSAFLSLDGVMQAPDSPEEDHTGGFTYGGWIVNYSDDSTAQVVSGTFRAAGLEQLARDSGCSRRRRTA